MMATAYAEMKWQETGDRILAAEKLTVVVRGAIR
jgi:hypothetical protein